MGGYHPRDVARFCEQYERTTTVMFPKNVRLCVDQDVAASDFGWWAVRGALEVRWHGWDAGLARLVRAHGDRGQMS